MTLLQQICADMVASQDQLQRLHGFERARLAGKFVSLPGMAEDIRHAQAIHEAEQARCAYLLSRRFPAANDATILPGAA